MKFQMRILTAIITIVCAFNLPAYGQSLTKEFYQYNCRLTLPDQTWQWNDNLDAPGAIAFAQSGDGVFMILTAMHQGRDVPISDEFIRGFEGGAIKQGGRKIHGQKMTYNNVPCYQLIADQGISNMLSCTRVFYGDQTAYSFQFLMPRDNGTDAEKLNRLFGAFTFIAPPTVEYSEGKEASQAYRLGQMVGEITFWILLVGVAVFIYRKLGRIRIGKQRN